jgi:hypothetical protein
VEKLSVALISRKVLKPIIYHAPSRCVLFKRAFGWFIPISKHARVAELVDARDLKSLGRKAVPVRFRSRAPEDNPTKCDEVREALRNQGFFWNRVQKIEGLEKDRFDLKKKSNTLEKENILLGEENLKLLKEIMALKKENPTHNSAGK